MKPYLRTKDYSVTGETFELIYDSSLKLLSTQPQPQDLEKYYESHSYISHTDANKTLIDKLYQGVKKYSLLKKVRLISKYSSEEKTLLDVGAGTGDFLLRAKKSGWAVQGVEPNHDARLRAEEKGLGLNTRLHSLPNKKFAVITLWHVLEHLPNLEKQIENLVSRLTEKGTLVIAVPNYKSYDAEHYGPHWAAFDVPRHLWHFSKESIQCLFANYGLKVVRVKPMIFDSFYVSLLSEKYKTGRHNYFKAFAIGLWSNLKALGSKEYSSHIYILKRAQNVF
jgi:2-polyprenyl-3-methyl-5-hydroxy-6-metoxy-1,4-benzoquinol methylase